MSGLDLGLCADADVLVAKIESHCEECDRDDYAREVSVVGSPLVTDDDRRSGRADHDQQSQGGPAKSKHSEVVVDETTKDVYDADVPPMGHISAFRAELLTEAKSRFAQLLSVEVSEVRDQRLSRTSLGVEGWACAKVLTESDLVESWRGDSPCCAFGAEDILGMIPGVNLLDDIPI